jgi:chromosome segregation protein
LVREVRRQMRPLERQAVSARSYTEVESELRDARHALFAARLNNFEQRRRVLELALEEASVRERELRHELVNLDAKASAAAAEMASRREEMLASTLGTLQGLAERARGTSSIIQERERSLRQALIASADENVIATLEADAAKLGADLEGLNADELSLNALREALGESRRRFSDVEAAFESTWSSSSSESDEGALNAAREQISLLERSLASLQESERRATQRLTEARVRAAAVTAAKEQAVHEKQRVDAALKEAAVEATQAEEAVERAQRNRRVAEESFQAGADLASRSHARAETLARALDELSGAGGRAIIGNLEGVLGSFLDLIEVDAGSERAVESAAGASVGAMVVDGRRSARAALAALRKEGGAGLILPVGEGEIATLATPKDTRAVRSLVRARRGAPAHVDRVLDALFARAFVASDWESGIEVALANPDLVVVTEDGDRFASSGWRVASGRAVVTRLTVDEADTASKGAASELESLRRVRDEVEMTLGAALERLGVATTTLANGRNDDERLQSELERLSLESDELVDSIDTGSSDVGDLAEQILTLESDLVVQREQLPALEQALAQSGEREERRSEAKNVLENERRSVDEKATALSRREAEFAERRRLIEQRRGEIEARLEGRSGERLEAATRRQSLEFDRQVLTRLAALVNRAGEEIHVAQEAMDSTYREQLEATRASAELLEDVRQSRHGADARLSELGEVMRRHEIEQAELAVKVANVHDVIRRDLALEPHEMGPAPLIELAEGVSLETRVGELEARITSLGPINPLALEELANLEDRYKDLDAQVSDVRHARRELQEVVRALDEEIMQTFTKAFADVNEHFSSLIAMLFPGGQGRLNMSEPEDPLNTGVEIEVRPMGRNVRRISLLSGGERSMAALAFLFAVFRSRPSPFYLMDEVEAALDDVNLQRFLSLVDEFRDEAQLLIVTHQKRTMEAADALYGVTMVPGASSKVVSQRVTRAREVETA